MGTDKTTRREPLPDNFDSLEQFWRFWDTHSSADYEDLMTPVHIEADLPCTVHAVVYPGDESGYVAECLDLALVTQGETLDQTVENLREAVQLHLEDNDAI